MNFIFCFVLAEKVYKNFFLSSNPFKGEFKLKWMRKKNSLNGCFNCSWIQATSVGLGLLTCWKELICFCFFLIYSNYLPPIFACECVILPQFYLNSRYPNPYFFSPFVAFDFYGWFLKRKINATDWIAMNDKRIFVNQFTHYTHRHTHDTHTHIVLLLYFCLICFMF